MFLLVWRVFLLIMDYCMTQYAELRQSDVFFSAEGLL